MHGSAMQCYISDVSIKLWKRPLFKGPPTENPLTDQYQILNSLLTS
jgi:hypothetical protein